MKTRHLNSIQNHSPTIVHCSDSDSVSSSVSTPSGLTSSLKEAAAANKDAADVDPKKRKIEKEKGQEAKAAKVEETKVDQEKDAPADSRPAIEEKVVFY